VLVVDDEHEMSEFVSRGLRLLGFDAITVSSAPQALELVRREAFDLVTTDVRMPGMNGLQLCGLLREGNPHLPVIILTAYGDFDTAVDAMRVGAYDLLLKPFDIDALDVTVRRVFERLRLDRELPRAHSIVPGADRSGLLLGESPAMRKVGALLARLASSDSSVLVTGESGTGKELVAAALHRESSRRAGPFVAINCAALPHDLLEAELFGHERGAFTDARVARAGLFVEANGGTLFLDEIAEMPLALQAKLLRALQERVVRPLGGRKELPFDVRLITATNANLDAAVDERHFRQDLYFRINVIEVALPPLRARANDAVILAMHFLDQFAARMQKRVLGFTPEVSRKLLEYSWPGNVRELQNTIERAVALAGHDYLTLDDLPPKIARMRHAPQADDDVPLISLDELERRHIVAVLKKSSGSKSVAAKILGLDRSTLWRKLERFRDDDEPGPE
jgi:DNA-binding NtrC family response regulator